MANDITKGYVFDLESNLRPVAALAPAHQEVVLGAIARLDGRASVDPELSDLSYIWSFTQVPIGSQVANFGFVDFEEDGSVVTFAPDVAGHYQVQLVVSDGTLTSAPALCEIDSRVILVPNHQGLVPDASFIWQYLSDFWTRVEGRRKFEVFWSAAIQVIGGELLKLYQYDYNKSIKDIQSLLQRRWLHYDTGLTLAADSCSFILAEDQAGNAALTTVIDPLTGISVGVQPDYSNIVSVPRVEGNFELTSYGGQVLSGRVLQLGDRGYIMQKSAALTVAVQSGTDGSSTGTPTNQFNGSGFDPAHAGVLLKLNSGPDLGTYIILAVLNSTGVLLGNLDGVTTPTLHAIAGVAYSVLPLRPTHSSFYADQLTVPTRQLPQPWRFSSTLISAEHDFEALGVSPGDLVEVEITRLDNSCIGTFYVQVVAAERNRLGFVVPLADQVDGVVAGGFSPATQLSLAEALKIPSIITMVDGSMLYSDDAAAVRALLRSAKFKRTYYETLLTPDSEISLGAFSVKLRPIQILRLKKIPIDAAIDSIPVLQEYINQPDLVTQNSQLYQVVDNTLYPLEREPKILVENLDYIVDDEAAVSGICRVQQGSDIIGIPYGDLVDRSVQGGDQLLVDLPAGTYPFRILRVVDNEAVQVAPVPSEDAAAVTFKLVRKVSGKFIRFVKKILDRTQRVPARWWSEVSYFDNSDAIEANFGEMVQFTKEQFDSQYLDASYLSAVGGLMYGLTKGSTVADLELSGQILLGLPFAQNQGVISELNPDYRKQLNGAPYYGRIVVSEGVAGSSGRTVIYLYPRGRQIETAPGVWEPALPEFCGLALNPATGKEYQVGDTVEQYVPLSKGVAVQDYLEDASWFNGMVEQGDIGMRLSSYHAFRFIANADIASPATIDLAAQFLNKSKPSYQRLFVSFLKGVEDYIEIKDPLIFSFGYPPVFFDTPAFSLPMAMKFGQDASGDNFFTFNGQLYCRYLEGGDLKTTQGSDEVNSVSGGFVYTRPSYAEQHDSPYIRPGDIFYIPAGMNAGYYPIRAVGPTTPYDQNLSLDLGTTVFETAIAQSFSIFRPLAGLLFDAGCVVASGSATLDEGGFSAGVGVGDTLLLYTATTVSQRYCIRSFNPFTKVVQTVPAIVESGAFRVVVVREPLLTKYLMLTETAPPCYGDFVSLSNWFTFRTALSDLRQVGLLRRGDVLRRSNGDVYTVIAFDAANLRALITPAPTSNSANQPVTLLRPYRSVKPVGAELQRRAPEEELDLTLYYVGPPPPDSGKNQLEDLLTTAASAVVTSDAGEDFADLHIELGDELILEEGADTGTYFVLSSSGSSLTLADKLTATGGPYKYRIRRRTHEG